ncbi:MAG: phage holin family protein [Lachnospiraceae bacterium]|nr:phage holin family protein [Lachnospiraceae bacterium]
MKELATILTSNIVFQMVTLTVVMDTFFGIWRAIKQRKFNSSVGIDGAIRKIAMITSLVFLAIIDSMLGWNLIGFVIKFAPEEAREYLQTTLVTVGLVEIFGILYLSYEVVSTLKNMSLCDLPVKKLWKMVTKFLGKYTDELPDNETEDELEEQKA